MLHTKLDGMSAKGVFLIALLVAVIMGQLSLPARAQSAGTASVQGTVTDATGAAVPNAKLVLTQTDTGTSRTTTSDGAGLYSLPNVPVGPYSLSVDASGFSSFTQKGVLEVGNNVQINPALKVGTSNEHIEVQASGVALETETSSFKQVIDQKRITELPLNGRQATQLVLVAGGAVTAPSGDMVGSKNYYSSTVIAVAGSQGNYNNYVLDGGYHTDNFTNVNLPYPFPDALHEFSVESNSLPARNGVHPGSLVNVITNAGTNQWHGTLFDFVRNNVINATNFFSPTKDTIKRNQFGGTFGGRIITDRLFFFGGYQGTREHKSNNATGYCVPTPAMLQGDFSHMLTTGNCAAATTTNFKDPITGVVTPSRKIPTSEFSPAANNLVTYLPLALADSVGHVNVALPANNTEDQYIGRVDFTWSQRHNLFGRYFITDYYLPAYYSRTNILLTTLPGNDERVQSFTLGDTFIFSPRIVNTFHGTYSRRRDNRGPTAGGINATTIGVNNYVYTPVDLRIQMNGGFATGCGTCTPGFFNVNTEDFADDVDWLIGKHQIAIGGEYIRTGDNTRAGYLFNGSYSFGGAASGETLADFLTGQMTTFGTSFAFSQSRAQDTTYRQNIFGIYAQDTWHIIPPLTISYGLRWEPNLYQTDKFGRGATFDQAAFNANQHSVKFPNAPAGAFYYGDAGVPKSFTNNQWANISPRVAFILDPYSNGKTILRAGGALMYDSPSLYTSQRVASNPPFVNEIDFNGQTLFDNPWRGYPGGIPFPGTFPPNASATFPTNTLWVLLQKKMQTPVIYQWNASIQQELGRGWMFSINYLGNQQAHQWLGNGINAATYISGNWTGPGSCQGMPQVVVPTASNPNALYPLIGNPCSSTGNPNARTPLTLKNNTQGQGYSPTMTLITDGSTTSYNGMIAAIQHRMSNNFSFLGNYTWSKCLAVADNPGDIAAPAFEHSLNPRLDRGPCGFDVRHIFNTTLVASSHFASLTGWKGALVNNWQAAPLIRILSGAVLNVTSGQDNSRTGLNLDRPNLINPGVVYTGNKIQRTGANLAYLSKAAFAQNAMGTYGNLSRNAFRQPSYYNVDLSISRIFPIHERLDFQLRMESFNIFNHPNFNAFTTGFNSGTFGNATAAADPRIFQLAGKFTF
jgi:hypothetical protein